MISTDLPHVPSQQLAWPNNRDQFLQMNMLDLVEPTALRCARWIWLALTLSSNGGRCRDVAEDIT
jgi:hypothetical protein